MVRRLRPNLYGEGLAGPFADLCASGLPSPDESLCLPLRRRRESNRTRKGHLPLAANGPTLPEPARNLLPLGPTSGLCGQSHEEAHQVSEALLVRHQTGIASQRTPPALRCPPRKPGPARSAGVGRPADSHPEIHHWRTTTGEEVDFVIAADRKLLPVEVKTTSRPRYRDTKNLLAFRRENPDTSLCGLVLHTGDAVKQLAPGVLAAPWWTVV